MATCPVCSSPAPADAPTCPRCGSDLTPTSVPDGTVTSAAFAARAPSVTRDDATATSFGPVPRSGRSGTLGRSALSSLSGGGKPGEGLVPGSLVNGRYRIVAKLGAGGMGEVYRADDLHLGQGVALKFLPLSFSDDPRRVDAFRSEVRLAREVTHANVCRVHDIGEVDGQLFLSMEYIDGEDLGTLLRRIGRVPQDKAVEFARQICAGLAAAHERGVLHRDLKPANIMIDGRGRARLTDFGVAGLAGAIAAEDVRSGTPVYMAPEQLAGREVSVRSDIYSLGLVLYELFTGRRAFSGDTFAELRDQRERSEFTSISQLVQDVDPAVERVIARCLDPEPARRPSSAIAVSAALPGGDPLAAALAAGETPSPEMVAAAAGEGALPRRLAWAWFAAAIVCIGFMAWQAGRYSLVGVAPPPKPPDVLEEKARDILKGVGYDLTALDSDRGLTVDEAKLQRAAARNHGRLAAGGVQADGMRFWYRQHTRALEPFSNWGTVSIADPPPTDPGMATLVLSASGQLVQLAVPPPPVEEPLAGAVPRTDWKPLIAAAGLDPDKAEFVPATWTPQFHSDERVAIRGIRHDGFDREVRIEAAAYRGRPVYAVVVDQDTKPRRGAGAGDDTSAKERAASVFGTLVFVGGLAGAALLARRNLRAGRGDRRGAFRMGLAVFLAGMVANVLEAHPPSGINAAFQRLLGLASVSLLVSALLWLLYLALEPRVRRTRPESLFGWTRLLTGKVNDPRVGTELLIGAALGGLMLVTLSMLRIVPDLLGWASTIPEQRELMPLLGPRFLVGSVLDRVINSLLSSMLLLFFASLDGGRRGGGRYPWIGYSIFYAVSLAIFGLGAIQTAPLLVALPVSLVAAALFTVVFMRYGLVAATVAMIVINWSAPMALVPGNWTFGTVLVLDLFLFAIPVYGFWTALGGRSPFGEPAA